MKLKTTGIDHVNLSVINLEASCTFWKQLLGFEVLEEMPEEHGRIIGTREAKLALYESPDMAKQVKGGFAHVCFHIENFDEAEAACTELGIAILYGGVIKWAHSRSIYIADPNGYEVELAEVWGGGLT
jgi:lactoylglutathione lyase